MTYAATILLPAALGWSLFTIAWTAIPALPKIRDALAGRGGING